MSRKTHIGLFEGIAGFSLASKALGWETVAWCEWNPHCQSVLKSRFPNAEGFGDIVKTDFKKYANKIDVLTGGFPCQPYSTSGKRLGKEDERHLWPEMLRAIQEIQPRWVVGENVRGIISWNGGMVFNEVQADLEAAGYEVLPLLLPACAVNAPHRRDRIWFVAYRGNFGLQLAGGTWNWRSGFENGSANGPFENANSDGRGSELRQEESEKRGFGNVSPGDHERLQTDNGETGVVANGSNAGLESVRQRRENQVYEFEPTTDTKSKLSTEREHGGHSEQREIQLQIGAGNSISADTDGIGWREDNCKGKSGFINQNSAGINWHNFPTQPPICRGNDGIPVKLVRAYVVEFMQRGKTINEFEKIQR